MTKEEYLTTININGISVDIGLDDYGQCYFYEYEKDGQIISQGCGTYNTEFIECVYFELDPVFHKLETKYLFDDPTEDEIKRYKAYIETFKELYKNIFHIN